MAVDREAIYQALQTRLSSSLSPVTISRRVKHWSEVPPSDQPAVFIEQGDQTSEGDLGKPSKWKLNAVIYAYVTDTSATGPYPALNSLVKNIESALERQPGESGGSRGPTTLGGIVSSCRTVGVIDTGGALGDQAVAVIDLEIHTTS